MIEASGVLGPPSIFVSLHLSSRRRGSLLFTVPNNQSPIEILLPFQFAPCLILTLLGALAAFGLVSGGRGREHHLLSFRIATITLEQPRPPWSALLPSCNRRALLRDGQRAESSWPAKCWGGVHCSLALLIIYVLIDLNDNIDNFQKGTNLGSFLLQYYLVILPPSSFSLSHLASSLDCSALGKLSSVRSLPCSRPGGLARSSCPSEQ